MAPGPSFAKITNPEHRRGRESSSRFLGFVLPFFGCFARSEPSRLHQKTVNSGPSRNSTTFRKFYHLASTRGVEKWAKMGLLKQFCKRVRR